MATNKFLLGILCLVITYGNGLFNSRAVKGLQKSQIENKISEQRIKLLNTALTQVGIRERTGNNDGDAVSLYLKYVNLQQGSPWCAAFVSWVYGQQGLSSPKTAWSPSLFPLARQALNPQGGDVFGIYLSKLDRIAHCGLVEKRVGNWLATIEGNTNLTGSREGDGVYRKIRHVKSIKVYADWLRISKKGGVQ